MALFAETSDDAWNGLPGFRPAIRHDVQKDDGTGTGFGRNMFDDSVSIGRYVTVRFWLDIEEDVQPPCSAEVVGQQDEFFAEVPYRSDSCRENKDLRPELRGHGRAQE